MADNKFYVTAQEGQRLSFPYDWRQTFDHPFEMGRVVNEAQTIKAFIADDAERQMGLEILKLLLDYTFATQPQLERLLATKNIEGAHNLDSLLLKYADSFVANYSA